MRQAHLVGIAFFKCQVGISLPPDVGAQRIPDRRVEEVAEIRWLRDASEVQTNAAASIRARNRKRSAHTRHDVELPAALDDRREEIDTIGAEIDARTKRFQA